ncbi:MAG: zinc ribbon domain-containing protein [Erysipelotrichaceae bacterium]|nr:zinc ribbon domain-containing protein [Erysipelotrichaceae bacterium]
MTETKKCIYCGRDLEADMIFCPRCGRPVPTERQDDDKLGETLIFNINDRSIPPVPVMRTAKLVDTGIFPVIKDENFPKETPAVPKKPVEEKPAEPVMPELIQEETSDDDLLSFLDLGDDNDEPEEKIAASSSIPLFFTSSIPAMNPSAPKEEIPEPVIPAVPAEEPAVEEAPPAAPAEEQQTEEAPEETIRMTVDEPEAEDVPDSFNIPFVQRETDHTITMEDLPVIEDISEENLKEETSEYDALGDLHNVLKTLLADDSTTEEEDVLDGNYTRDSRPADSSYDVPFILRQTRNDDENTQTALRLAGLNPDEPEGSDFVNPLDEEADTEELDVPFILSKAPAHLDPQTTEIYTNLFREEENAEKKLVDEGQTVIFKPVEKEPEPVRKPERVRKP